jgi:hypothetical protein
MNMFKGHIQDHYVVRRQSLKIRHSIAILCQNKVPIPHRYMAHGYIHVQCPNYAKQD